MPVCSFCHQVANIDELFQVCGCSKKNDKLGYMHENCYKLLYTNDIEDGNSLSCSICNEIYYIKMKSSFTFNLKQLFSFVSITYIVKLVITFIVFLFFLSLLCLIFLEELEQFTVFGILFLFFGGLLAIKVIFDMKLNCMQFIFANSTLKLEE